jgi:hypothetical protein
MTSPTDGGASPHRRQHDAFDWVTLIVGILTLVAVGIYTAIQAWQTTLIRSNNAVSQRASVYFEPPVGAIAKDPDAGEWLAFQFTIANSGNTRTSNLNFQIKCTSTRDRQRDPWGLLHQEPMEHLPQVIFPHSKVPAYCGFQFNDIAEMKAGRLWGYLLGEVTYFDVLDRKLYITQMAQTVNVIVYTPRNGETPPQVGVQLQGVGIHNCTDEDCPK